MSIEDVEAEHGFTFGGTGETANAPAVASVVCQKPGCPNLGHHVQVHADTALPVHCGGCAGVLLCLHNYESVALLEGTLVNPVKVTSNVCAICHDVKDKTRVELPTVDISQLPASAFAAHIGQQDVTKR